MKRPASIITFGILNIAFAVFAFFGILMTVLLLFVTAPSRNPVVQLMHDNPGYAAWIKISMPLGFISCVLLLVAGIGLLLMKNWARVLSMVYAVYALLAGTVGLVLNFMFMVRPLMERAGHQHGPEAAGAIGGAVGGLFGGCFALLYPILLLIFMTRPKLVAALNQGTAQAPPEVPSA